MTSRRSPRVGSPREGGEEGGEESVRNNLSFPRIKWMRR